MVVVHVVHSVERFEPRSSEGHDVAVASGNSNSANHSSVVLSQITLEGKSVGKSIVEGEGEWLESWDNILADTVVRAALWWSASSVSADDSWNSSQAIDESIVGSVGDDEWISFVVNINPLDFVGVDVWVSQGGVDEGDVSVGEAVDLDEVLGVEGEIHCVSRHGIDVEGGVYWAEDELSRSAWELGNVHWVLVAHSGDEWLASESERS